VCSVDHTLSFALLFRISVSAQCSDFKGEGTQFITDEPGQPTGSVVTLLHSRI
jgi:hypothetical protein